MKKFNEAFIDNKLDKLLTPMDKVDPIVQTNNILI